MCDFDPFGAKVVSGADFQKEETFESVGLPQLRQANAASTFIELESGHFFLLGRKRPFLRRGGSFRFFAIHSPVEVFPSGFLRFLNESCTHRKPARAHTGGENEKGPDDIDVHDTPGLNLAPEIKKARDSAGTNRGAG